MIIAYAQITEKITLYRNKLESYLQRIHSTLFAYREYLCLGLRNVGQYSGERHNAGTETIEPLIVNNDRTFLQSQIV